MKCYCTGQERSPASVLMELNVLEERVARVLQSAPLRHSFHGVRFTANPRASPPDRLFSLLPPPGDHSKDQLMITFSPGALQKSKKSHKTNILKGNHLPKTHLGREAGRDLLLVALESRQLAGSGPHYLRLNINGSYCSTIFLSCTIVCALEVTPK